MISSQIPMIS